MTGENKSPSALVYSSQSPQTTPAVSGSNCHLFPVLLPCAQACAGVGVGARTAFFRADAFFGKTQAARTVACLQQASADRQGT